MAENCPGPAGPAYAPEQTITVMLTTDEADMLIRAWNGEAAAISSRQVSLAIEAIADALDQYEATAPKTSMPPPTREEMFTDG